MLFMYFFFAIFPLCITFPLLEDCEILDLTHEFSGETKYWGEINKFKLETIFKGLADLGKYYYAANKFSAAEHGGTHLDAPSHYSLKGLTNEKVPLKNLIGEACVVDVSKKAAINSDYQMTMSDLEEWEVKHGRLNERCILLMRTDWDAKFSNSSLYFGSETPSDTKTYHFPGLSPETAQWLVDTNRLKAFGLDTPSVDYGASAEFEAHRILSGRNICNLENLMNLYKLPPRGATLIALPMKIKGGSGGPVRVIAVGWNGPDDPCVRTTERIHSQKQNSEF